MRFKSKKVIDGFSTCFRQWIAKDTHCSFAHGYGIYFTVTFEGELDYRSWVMDFGFMKRSQTTMKIAAYDKNGFTPDEWFKYWFDHTVIIAEDDPARYELGKLDGIVLQLRILPHVGMEMFAKFVFEELNKFLYKETEDRVRVVEVECHEHNKNSAIYCE